MKNAENRQDKTKEFIFFERVQFLIDHFFFVKATNNPPKQHIPTAHGSGSLTRLVDGDPSFAETISSGISETVSSGIV